MYNSKSYDRKSDLANKPTKSERKAIKQQRKIRKSKFHRYEV